MIEIVLHDYLNNALTVPAYMEFPKNPPQRFVTLEKTSSGLVNQIGSAVFAIQSHAESMYQAALLNDELKAAMLDAVVLNDIASVRLNSDYNYTDGTTKDYRYQAVYEITHY